MHGSNRVNQMMIDNPLIKELFDTRVLALNYVQAIDEIGKFQVMKYIRLMGYLFQLCWLLPTYRPDAVYFVPCVTGTPFWRDCLFVTILKTFRIQRVYHLHAKGIRDQSNNPVMRRIYKWFFKGAQVILLSAYLYQDIEAIVPEDRIFYLPNGTDVETDEISFDTLGQTRKTRFIFLSNLISTKGPETLLEACCLLKKKGYQFSTTFVGNTSKELTREVFESLIHKMGLKDCVSYLGPKYGAQKSKEFLASDVMIFPTFKDCFPLVLLEAMAFGLPIISTLEGAIPDIVEEEKTGFLVPDRNPEALALKMALFIDNTDLIRHLGKNARQKFLNQYTLKAFNQRATQLLSEILKVGSKNEIRYGKLA